MNEKGITIDSIFPINFKANKTIEFKLIINSDIPEADLPAMHVGCSFILFGFRLISEIDSLSANNPDYITFQDRISLNENPEHVEKTYKVQAKNQEEVFFAVTLDYNGRSCGAKKYQFYRTESGKFAQKK
jgi:hypothetical protein